MDVAAFIEAFRKDPGSSGFCLDFDGTLSQIVEEHRRAEPVEGAPEVLELLAAKYAVVALVSGRRAEQLSEIVGADGVDYYGIYGAERITDGRLVQPPDADRWRGMASRIARDAEAFLLSEGLAGCEVEYKDLAVAIHFRNAANPHAGEMIEGWAKTMSPRRGFRAGTGRMVVEVRPDGVAKSVTLQRIVEENALGRLIAGGDDSADVEALAAARRLLGGNALTVGVDSTEAPANLADVADVIVESPLRFVELLRRLA